MNVGRHAGRIVFAALLLCAGSMSGCRTMTRKPAVTVFARVADVQLIGFDVLPPYALQELRTEVSSKARAPFSDALEQSVGTLAVETLQNHGYPYGEVRIARESAGPGLVRLVVTAVPGRVGFFGRTDIAGNVHVDDRIIRSRLAYLPGELFRRSALEQSQAQLASLELFKSVRIEIQRIDPQPPDVPILITVTEQSSWRWNAGLGYADRERLGLEARVANMNFFGDARRLEINGRISKIDHLLEAGFTQPQLRTPRLSLSLLARDWSIDDPALHAVSTGGQAAVTWVHDPRSSATFAYAVSRERGHLSAGVVDPLTRFQNGMLSAWSVHLDHGTFAAASTAPSGRAWTLHLEQAGGWMPGDFNYYNVIAGMREYHTSDNGRLTLAAFARYGSITPMHHQESEIPVLKRLFLGGSDQMRGWSRFEVGPVSSSGEPIGGRSLLAGTVELRSKIVSKLRGVLFLDAGNVWRSDWTVHPGELKFDAGPGLRVESPFGLVRADVGYQLNRVRGLRIDGQPERHRWRLSLSIGEAF